VLIGERTALTAAHCVEAEGALHVRLGDRQIPVRACVVHPLAYAASRGCNEGRGRTNAVHDLAVLTLAETVEIGPVPLLFTAPGLDSAWWIERPVRLVGWDRRPRFVGPLERRSGTNQITRLGGGGFVTEPAQRSGFSTIIGDSGGPALVRIGGAEHLAGVLSGGTAPGSRASVYAATFEPLNAAWLIRVLPSVVGQDLDMDEAAPFGAASPLSVRSAVR